MRCRRMSRSPVKKPQRIYRDASFTKNQIQWKTLDKLDQQLYPTGFDRFRKMSLTFATEVPKKCSVVKSRREVNVLILYRKWFLL